MVDVSDKAATEPGRHRRGTGAHGRLDACRDPCRRRQEGRRHRRRRASPASWRRRRPPTSFRSAIRWHLTKVSVDIAPDDALPGLAVRAEARCVGPTGVEMEALTAVSVACLTIYDMAKAIDRGMSIEGVRLIEKRGGKSGEWRAAKSRRTSADEPDDHGRGGAGAACSPPPRRRSRRKRSLSKALMAGCSRATLRRFAPSRRSPTPPWTAMRCAPRTRRSPPATLTVIGESAAGRAFDGRARSGRSGAHLHRRADARRRRRHRHSGGREPRGRAHPSLGAPSRGGDNLRAAGMDFRDGRSAASPPAAGSPRATSRWPRRPIIRRSASAGAPGSRSWRPATNWSRPAARSGRRRSSPPTISPSPELSRRAAASRSTSASRSMISAR